MYIEVDKKDGCNVLDTNWLNNAAYNWRIHIAQISCTAPYKAPTGCSQYMTGSSTGYIQSYNYDGG